MNDQLRVLMLGWEYPPFSSGGLGTHCYNIVRALDRKGAKITLIVPGSTEQGETDSVKVVKAGRGKIIRTGICLAPYIPSLPVSVKKKGGAALSRVYGESFFRDVLRFTDAAVETARDIDCDVIHCHDWMTFLAGMRIKEEKKKPMVVTVHSTEYDRTGFLCPSPWICDIEWQGMSSADRVIAVSELIKDRIMEKYSLPGDKIDVVYNSIDPGSYDSSKLSFGLDEKVVLYLGRLTIQKGPDYFLRAAKRVLEKESRVRFVVVGTGDMLPQLIDESIGLGIGGKVTFTGYQESIDDFYRMADLYVMPSVSEPFGITALEAMASGTPVLVSKSSGVKEVISHRLTFDFWDVDSLASKIIGGLRYDCLRSEMGSNGHREVSRMSWASAAEDTIGVYGKAIN